MRRIYTAFKRKKLAIAVIAFYCIALAVGIFQPERPFQPPPPTPSPIITEDQILRNARPLLHYRAPSVDFSYLEINDPAVANEILDILKRYYSVRDLPNPFREMSFDVVLHEISFALHSGPIHILLGEISFHYSCGTETMMHRIIDPEALIEEIEAVLLGHID